MTYKYLSSQEVHKKRRELMNSLRNDKEEFAQTDREVAKLIDEIAKARMFLQYAVPYLQKICPHRWRPSFLGEYYCEECSKNSENRPEEL